MDFGQRLPLVCCLMGFSNVAAEKAIEREGTISYILIMKVNHLTISYLLEASHRSCPTVIERRFIPGGRNHWGSSENLLATDT